MRAHALSRDSEQLAGAFYFRVNDIWKVDRHRRIGRGFKRKR